MGCTAAIKARSINQNVEHILALELMAAAQGIDFRRQDMGQDKQLGRGTRAAYELIRTKVPFIEQDEPLAPYMSAVHELVSSGAIVREVERALSNEA